MHLVETTLRFQICQQDLSVERRFRNVAFEGVSFLQVQFEQNHFYQVNFADCNFSDVIFHGCTFIDCRFERGVFQNVHFQNCTLIDTAVGDGDMDTLVHFQNSVFLGVLPQSGEFSQNWAMGAEGKLAKGLQSLPRIRPPAGQTATPTRPATAPTAAAAQAVAQSEILKRQREAEQVLPLEPSSGRFNGLEK
jgi:hypothetical protein